MKLLANIGIIATACVLCSAAPAARPEPANPQAEDAARGEVRERYFSDAANRQLKQSPQVEGQAEPKWVESMQQLLKDLADDNTRLRQENQGLRADAEALKRQLEVYEQERRRQKQNQGTFVLPPDALKGLHTPQGSGQAPPNWRPFEFNGATYYIVPLRHGPQSKAPQPERGDRAIDVTRRDSGSDSPNWTVTPVSAARSK